MPLLARIFHTLSSRDGAKARLVPQLAGRTKRLRAGLDGDILSGEQREANAARWARSKSQQKGCEISGLEPTLPFPLAKIRAWTHLRSSYVKNITYFDLETQLSAEEAGGWNKISAMRMSIGVIYSTLTRSYRIFGEKDVDQLVRELQRADLIVGFNNLRFDYEVLHGYTTFDLRQLPTVDMLVDLQKTLQHRLSLDAVASATLGVEKTSDGLQALRWFKEGRLLDIAEYCCYDVKITRLVHEYGCQAKLLHYTNRFGKKLTVPVDWSLTA